MADVQLFRYKWIWPQRDGDRWRCQVKSHEGQVLHTTDDAPDRDAAIRAAKHWINRPPAPLADLWKDEPDEVPEADDTPDYGGAYDGTRVSSDADPGL